MSEIIAYPPDRARIAPVIPIQQVAAPQGVLGCQIDQGTSTSTPRWAPDPDRFRLMPGDAIVAGLDRLIEWAVRHGVEADRAPIDRDPARAHWTAAGTVAAIADWVCRVHHYGWLYAHEYDRTAWVGREVWHTDFYSVARAVPCVAYFDTVEVQLHARAECVGSLLSAQIGVIEFEPVRFRTGEIIGFVNAGFRKITLGLAVAYEDNRQLIQFLDRVYPGGVTDRHAVWGAHAPLYRGMTLYDPGQSSYLHGYGRPGPVYTTTGLKYRIENFPYRCNIDNVGHAWTCPHDTIDTGDDSYQAVLLSINSTADHTGDAQMALIDRGGAVGERNAAQLAEHHYSYRLPERDDGTVVFFLPEWGVNTPGYSHAKGVTVSKADPRQHVTVLDRLRRLLGRSASDD